MRGHGCVVFSDETSGGDLHGIYIKRRKSYLQTVKEVIDVLLCDSDE
mgnify:CR=1 FL=1